ncbi:DUF4811 domain-containing protein [Agrilactobacillus fermenti]|uniref:DUF4811 domain-containing protein n=1 Tax=Agrilactobacillus fermenti TaxID=2586909 RepID=UPI001E57CF31|nr:DUF4811 domain-containing protein [Agrilactobacillus fermenti]MCD2256738.1 DUF4811 domain-containing protein [Agrilactobacillus fermenti]
MIIFLLILSVILFAIFMIGFKPGILKSVLVALSLVLMLGAITMFVANDQFHWGMKETTEVVDKPLTAAANINGTNTILYKPLGNGHEKIFIYKTNAQQKKVTTTSADVKVTNKLVRSAQIQHPVLTQTTYRYTYKNSGYRLLFAGTSSNNRYKKRTNTFKVPQTWVVLSTNQTAKLQKQAKNQKKVMAAKMKQVIQQQVQQARQQNPNMTAQEQKVLVQKIEAQAKAQAAQQVKTQLEQMSLK